MLALLSCVERSTPVAILGLPAAIRLFLAGCAQFRLATHYARESCCSQSVWELIRIDWGVIAGVIAGESEIARCDQPIGVISHSPHWLEVTGQ